MGEADGGMGGVVGELALVDASLCALLADMLEAASTYGPVDTGSRAITTGQLTRELLRVDKEHPGLINDDLTSWLLRVEDAADERNEVVHALGRDRCVRCGRSSRFEHRGKVIDRSEGRLRGLIGNAEALLADGVQLAQGLAETLNKKLVVAAAERAAETGQSQAPSQIRIAGVMHWCAECSESGRPQAVVTVGTAVGALPPGTGMTAFRQGR